MPLLPVIIWTALIVLVPKESYTIQFSDKITAEIPMK